MAGRYLTGRAQSPLKLSVTSDIESETDTMTKTPFLPSVAVLRAQDLIPRVHPNGFIQLDLNASHRLHVWHPRLPYRQKTYHPIHDHVFDFTSHVYGGRLVNVAYHLRPDHNGTHLLWEAHCMEGEESILKPDPLNGPRTLVQESVKVVQPGQSYFFPAFRFHETLSNIPTLTIIEKGGLTEYERDKYKPNIAVPIGVEPDNDYRRVDVDEEGLWELIAEAHPE